MKLLTHTLKRIVSHLPQVAGIALLSLMGSNVANAIIYSYYIGVDALQTFTSGTYNGQNNPNYNRLTFLYAHQHANPTTNHFHSVGRYQLTGPAATPTVTFGNVRLPEGSRPPLPLLPGTGSFSGKLVSTQISDPNIGSYSDIAIYPMSQLRAYHENGIPNEPEDYMYNSSGNRWSTINLAGSDVHFELLSLTPGLNIAKEDGTPLFAGGVGSDEHLGDGDTFDPFKPKFWVDAAAAPGIYEAKFKLVDEEGLFADGGEFRFEFIVVPEPSAALLGLTGLAALIRRRRTLMQS